MSRTCSRCRSELPRNSGYCVACGASNDGSVVEKSARMDQKVHAVQERQRFWRKIQRWLFWWVIR